MAADVLNVETQRELIARQMADPGKAPGRPRDIRAEQQIATVRTRHEHSDISPSTVINLLPLQLMVHSPMPELSIVIPPADRECGYSSHTWHKPAIEWAVIEGGAKVLNDFMPSQLAEQYLREYAHMGGVLAIKGTLADFDPARNPAQQRELDRARDAAARWLQTKVAEGNELWNTPQHSGSRDITHIHRMAAQWLSDNGRLNRLPEWYDVQAAVPDEVEPCPKCRTTPLPGALVCVTCANILDPARAFMEGIITEDHIALERLTREEVEDLGVSAFVAETADERPARLKKGLTKPLSVAARNQIKAQEAENARPPAAEEKSGKGAKEAK